MSIGAKSDEFKCASTNFDNHLPAFDSKSDVADETTSFLNADIQNRLINRKMNNSNDFVILI